MLATRDAEELHVPLLVLVFSQRSNVARREEQRRSWLSFGWHRGPSDAAAVPWRHLYVYGRSAAPRDSRGGRTVLYDQVVGDGVTPCDLLFVTGFAAEGEAITFDKVLAAQVREPRRPNPPPHPDVLPKHHAGRTR